MAIDPITGAIVGANALGGLFSGLSQGSAAKQGVQEQRREFNIGSAAGPTRGLETLPLRDRLLFLLNARFGPHPTTNTDAQNAYTAGAGGTANSQAIYEEMLRRMGYSSGGQPGYPQGGGTSFVGTAVRKVAPNAGYGGY